MFWSSLIALCKTEKKDWKSSFMWDFFLFKLQSDFKSCFLKTVQNESFIMNWCFKKICLYLSIFFLPHFIYLFIFVVTVLQGLPHNADRITGFKSTSGTFELLCNMHLKRWNDRGSFKKQSNTDSFRHKHHPSVSWVC